MEDAINEAMFEFAHTVQSLIKEGWKIGEIKYGEKRLGVSPSITLSKGDVIKQCYSSGEIESILRREWEQ